MAVAIVGMHRSGTSMVTRLLNLCGLYLGEDKDLIAAAEDNSEGFWEHNRFLAVNDEVLAAFGGGWDFPPLRKRRWEKSPLLSRARKHALSATKEFTNHRTWGWKDPRTSLTLPFWKELIPGLKVIICIRSPYAVYRSLERRGYASAAFSHNLWVAYNRQLLDATKPHERIITHYDAFFHDPEAELMRLVEFIGLDVSAQTLRQACQTVSMSLRHHEGGLENVYKISQPAGLIELYGDLCLQAGPVFHNSLSPDEIGKLEEIKMAQASRLLTWFKPGNSNLGGSGNALAPAQTAGIRRTEQPKATEQAQTLNATTGGPNGGVHSLPVTLYRPIQNVNNFIFKIIRIWRQEGKAGILVRVRDRVNLVRPYQRSTGRLRNFYDELFQTASGQQSEEFVPLDETGISPNELLVKLIAFYLPQYHPIPENDGWWGKGFTEWTNVSKAIPQFEGHYQPHFPGEFGFYDLRVPDVQKRQVALARKYGIHGFAFYYYWFQGKRLLEKPLDLFLASQENFPFCICWANENWTRRWDGEEKEILIQQRHSPESDLRFIEDIRPILQDHRYIRLNGRPVVIVYRVELLPEPEKTVRLWRDYCREAGIGDPYLVAVQGYGFENSRQVGFDAALEFPPHNHRFREINSALKIINPNYQGRIHSYYEAIQSFGLRDTLVPFERFKCIFPSWDNEARRPGKGVSFAFASPQAYQYWLSQICRQTIQRQADPEQRLVFINAWNEWAEGAHLEPDRKYGYAYLQATIDTLRSLRRSDDQPQQEMNLFHKYVEKKHETAVFVHLFYPDLWDEIKAYLANLEGDFDLFVSVPDGVGLETSQITDFHKDSYVFRCENRGRDIAPFLRLLKITEPYHYSAGLKLHTKRSTHLSNGNEWRTELYSKLIGSPALARTIVKSLAKEGSADSISIIAAEGHIISSEPYLASNRVWLEQLTRQANIPYFGEEFHFFAGSMFWFKPTSLLPLSLLPLNEDDFEHESGQLDGTLAHAIERFVGLFSERMGIPVFESNGEGLRRFTMGEKTIYKFAPRST